MALAVEVQFALEAPDLPSAEQLRGWAEAAWREPGHAAEVVIRVADEPESRRLNHDFRGRDRATNVLSFPYDPVPELELDHVGDLVLCAPVVAREAQEQGKAPAAHWAHMVVHGMLHLQGYDHEDDSEAADMERIEKVILAGLGYPDPYADDEKT
jgi:probable rRNA maturation factor